MKENEVVPRMEADTYRHNSQGAEAGGSELVCII